MTSKEKKDIVLNQVVKAAFKKAGFKSIGQTLYLIRNDYCIAANIQTSQFNSVFTGYSFWFNIQVFPQDVARETLKSGVFGNPIKESVLLPDCG